MRSHADFITAVAIVPALMSVTGGKAEYICSH